MSVLKVGPKEFNDGWLTTPIINMVTGEVVGSSATRRIDPEFQALMPKLELQKDDSDCSLWSYMVAGILAAFGHSFSVFAKYLRE